MNKILVVDDDPYIRELVTTLLHDEGFNTLEATDGADGLRKLGESKIDLCILDIMMPGIDGYEFTRSARKYYDFPILMLTAKGETSQKVKGFDLGADDYLTKPFQPAELVARVKALLKRYRVSTSMVLTLGRLIVDKNRYAISTDGHRYNDIPPKEFELLFTLGSQIGKTFPRNQLLDEIWGYDFEGNERTLDVHINRLRERFGEDEYGFKITTIRGLGYRLEVLS